MILTLLAYGSVWTTCTGPWATLLFLSISAIDWIEAANYYVCLRKPTCRRSMAELT